MNDLTIDRGDDRTIAMTVLSLDDPSGPLDLSTATLRFTAKGDPDDLDGDAVIAKTSTDGITTPSAGSVEVEINAVDTVGIDGNRLLYWDLQAQVAGKVRTLARGTLFIRPDISRTAP